MTREIDPWSRIPVDVQSVLICRGGDVLAAAFRDEPGSAWTATHTWGRLSDAQIQAALGSTHLRVTSTFPSPVRSLVGVEPVAPFVGVAQ